MPLVTQQIDKLLTAQNIDESREALAELGAITDSTSIGNTITLLLLTSESELQAVDTFNRELNSIVAFVKNDVLSFYQLKTSPVDPPEEGWIVPNDYSSATRKAWLQVL